MGNGRPSLMLVARLRGHEQRILNNEFRPVLIEHEMASVVWHTWTGRCVIELEASTLWPQRLQTALLQRTRPPTMHEAN